MSISSRHTEVPQTARILSLYHVYRLAIGLALLMLLNSELLNLSNPTPLRYSVWGYLGLNLALTLAIRRPNPAGLLGLALSDILMLLGIFYLAGGVSSGTGSLIVVSVAISNVLLQGTIGFFLAAVAAIGLIGTTLYTHLLYTHANGLLIQAGALGALGFAAAILVQWLSRRLQASERLALQRAQDVASLEALLNEQILQRIHSGILVLDRHNQVLMANQKACQLLDLPPAPPKQSLPLNPALQQALEQWLRNPARPIEPFEIKEGAAVQPIFTLLHSSDGPLLVVLEDLSLISQQAQQLKLASLGRLTASIAHEIRNPLGAISHAAQLLQESEQLNGADLRLAQIIQNQSQRMNLIIEKVLQLSRRKQTDVQDLELGQWLRDFTQEHFIHQQYPEQRVHLQHPDTALFTPMDSLNLSQILNNLIQNGLRYSAMRHDRPQVWLYLWQDPQTQQPILDITDDGPGVPNEHLQHLFEPFFTTDAQGTGLGLYLCRELCEANRAHIQYQPHSGAGGCFRITFAKANWVQ